MGWEAIMATETTRVKKMVDDGTVNGEEYAKRAHRELGDGERERELRKE